MSKKDNPSRRLAKAIASQKRQNIGEPPPVPEVFKGISIPAGGWLSHGFWRPVRDAFKAFGLDASNPDHWERLIYEFADAHFGTSRGRRTVWTDVKLCQLAADFATAKRAHPGKSDTAVCELLIKKGRYRNRKLEEGTIRRLLPKARKELAQAVADCRQSLRSNKINLTPDQEQKLPAIVIEVIANGDTHLAFFDIPFLGGVAEVERKIARLFPPGAEINPPF